MIGCAWRVCVYIFLELFACHLHWTNRGGVDGGECCDCKTGGANAIDCGGNGVFDACLWRA